MSNVIGPSGHTSGDGRNGGQMPLCEQGGMIPPQISHGEESKYEVRHQRRIDTNRKPSEPHADDESVDVVRSKLGPFLVDDPEGLVI